MKFSKFLSILLVMVIVVGNIPFQCVFAAETGSDSGYQIPAITEVTPKGDVGNLLTSDIEPIYDVQEGSVTQGSGVSEVMVDGSSVTVSFWNSAVCTMVVSVYDNQGEELLQYQTTEIDTINQKQEITLEMEPITAEYYQIKVMLLDDMQCPLCKEYISYEHTDVYEFVQNADVDDFDTDRVVNLDDDKTTNFFVLKEDVVQLTYGGEKNILTNYDEEKIVFSFSNIDNTISKLKPGDLFYYGEDGNTILAIVDDIQIQDGSAVIKGKRGNEEDFFEFVKINEYVDLYDEENNQMEPGTDLGYGLIYEGVTDQNELVRQKAPLGEIPRTAANRKAGTTVEITPVSVNFSLKKDTLFELPPKDYKGDTFDNNLFTGSIKGTMDLNFTASLTIKLNLYLFDDWKDSKLTITPKVSMTGSIKATADLIIWLSRQKYNFILMEVDTGVGVNITLEGSIKTSATISCDISYGPNSGFEASPSCNLGKTEAQVSCFIGIIIRAKIKVNFAKTYEVSNTWKIGIELSATKTIFDGIQGSGTTSGETIPYEKTEDAEKDLLTWQAGPKEIHLCPICFALSAKLTVSSNKKNELLDNEILSKGTFKKSISITLGTGYFSISKGEFDFGLGNGVKCPNKAYRIKFRVIDDWGNKIQNATITGFDKYIDWFGKDKKVELKTDENGEVVVYVENGEKYELTISGEAGNTKKQLVSKTIIQDFTSAQTVNVVLTNPDDINLDAQQKIAFGSCGDNLEWALLKNGVLYFSGKGYMDDYGVNAPFNTSTCFEPGEKDGELIEITIGDDAPWKKYADQIIMIRFDDKCDCKRIGSNAFKGFAFLNLVRIPETIRTIGDSAFYNCTNMILEKVPDDLQYIYDKAFVNCDALTDMDLTNVIVLGKSVFQDCDSLKSIILSDNLSDIPDFAFKNCEQLSTINIPLSLKYIGDEVFRNCEKLEGLKFGKSLKEIGSEAFSGCTSLTHMNLIGTRIQKVGAYFCEGCTSLEEVLIPDTVTEIGKINFQGMKNLTEVRLPACYTRLEKEMFRGCESLKKITIPYAQNVIELFGKYTDTETGGYYSCSVTDVYAKTTKYAIPGTLTEISVLGGDSIGSSAFRNMTSLKRVTLPDTVTSIYEYAFENCINLSELNVPNNLESIGRYSFNNCAKLTQMTLPDTLLGIDQSAFANCTGIKEITIPKSVTYIGNEAFAGCTGLTTMTIPETVTTFNESVFSGCTNLEDIEIKCTMRYYKDMFRGCVNLKKIAVKSESPIGKVIVPQMFPYESTGEGYYTSSFSTIYGGKTEQHSIPKTLEEVVFLDGTEVTSYAFYGMKSLKKVTLPDTVTGIGWYAFSKCNADVYIPNPSCEFSTASFSSFSSDYSGTIYGIAGSTAESYAKENGFQFEVYSPESLETAEVVSLNASPVSSYVMPVMTFYNDEESVSETENGFTFSNVKKLKGNR